MRQFDDPPSPTESLLAVQEQINERCDEIPSQISMNDVVPANKKNSCRSESSKWAQLSIRSFM